jgi:SAM-dependent methyltransferase
MEIGRNSPCPCGSGRKYKHCHFSIDQAPLELKYAAVQSVYAKNWVTAAKSHYEQQHYHWMAGILSRFKPARIFDVGCGSGHGLLALYAVLGQRIEVVSIDDNQACLDVAYDTLSKANITTSVIKRLETRMTPQGYVQVGTKIKNMPATQCTLIESDLCNDDFIEDALVTHGLYDVVTIWLTGTHMMRPNHASVRQRNITSEGNHRLYVQNKLYEVADRILRHGGVLQIVDRGEAPTASLLREDALRAHREQASVTSLQVTDLEYRIYIEPKGTRTPIKFTPGTSGRMPKVYETAFVSIISIKP